MQKKIPPNLSVDAYAFCLGKNRKVNSDSDLIFLNNPRHESLSVCLNSNASVSEIDTGNRAENNFSKFIEPEIIIRADENILLQTPLNLGQEKIFQALEFYPSDENWKFKFTGEGFMDKTETLCNMYGVEIFFNLIYSYF